MAKKESSKPKYIDYLGDVLAAVEMMDAKKRMKEDFDKEHQEAIKAVGNANKEHGNGFINISKARELISIRRGNQLAKAAREHSKLAKMNKGNTKSHG